MKSSSTDRRPTGTGHVTRLLASRVALAKSLRRASSRLTNPLVHLVYITLRGMAMDMLVDTPLNVTTLAVAVQFDQGEA